MKMKKLLLLPALLLTLSVGNVACSYHNDDNPNEYPDPQPEPEPEPEPGPDINQKYLEAAYTPNCFMVKPGQSVDIPILKAFAMWDLYAEWLGGDGFHGADPRTGSALAGPAGPDHERRTDSWTAGRRGFHRRIDGRQGGQRRDRHPHRRRRPLELARLGDALRSGCGAGRLRQNLHLGQRRRRSRRITPSWIATSEPRSTRRSSRNTAADSLAACGLMYQWGRKDPFPGDRDSPRHEHVRIPAISTANRSTTLAGTCS